MSCELGPLWSLNLELSLVRCMQTATQPSSIVLPIDEHISQLLIREWATYKARSTALTMAAFLSVPFSLGFFHAYVFFTIPTSASGLFFPIPNPFSSQRTAQRLFNASPFDDLNPIPLSSS